MKKLIIFNLQWKLPLPFIKETCAAYCSVWGL